MKLELITAMSSIITDPPIECPISCCIPDNPVTTPCGHTFDENALSKWRQTRNICPVCRTHLSGAKLQTNVGLRDMIKSWYELQQKLIKTQLRNKDLGIPSIPLEDILIDYIRPLGRGAHGVVKSGIWQGILTT